MYATDDVRLAAFLATKGHPVRAINFTPQGLGRMEFDDEARPDVQAYRLDALMPAKTLLSTYKLILRRIQQERQAALVGKSNA